MKHMLLCLVALSLTLSAQQAPPLQSPVVDPDGSVHFHLRAPNAQKVVVSLDSGQKFDLVKDEKGLWSVHTPPLSPDLYGYVFQVDGVNHVDPVNGDIKSNALNPNSMVLVPGATPQPWEAAPIPHGDLHRHFFRSEVAGDDRDFFVYTPPNYDPRRTYPLLVLLHGYSDMADGWTTVGKAHYIFDRLIANGKRPFIAVMPLGYGLSMKELRAGQVRIGDGFRRNTQGFEKSLLTEVLPRVSRTYKVSNKPNERAIAGLSMGGGETLYTGLRHLDQFAWIGAMSSAPQLMGNVEETLAALSEKDNSRIRLLWIAIGKDDFLLKQNRDLTAWLKSRNIRHTYEETEGAHTWLVWRRYLTTFLNAVNW